MSRLAARLKYRILRSPAAGLVKSARRVTRGQALAQRLALAQQLPADRTSGQCASRLSENGFVRLNRLIEPGDLAALAEAATSSMARTQDAALPNGVSAKGFWTRPLDADLVDGRIPVETAFTRFALAPRLLAALSASFGTLPLLDYVLLTVSRGSNQMPTQSQLWHRDHDDIRTIKVFVYLTDVVTERDGPFTFVPGPQSDAIGPLGRSHAPDSCLYGRAKTSDPVQVIAPRLSVFAVETSRCLHMGSRVAEGHERALFTATYTTAPRIFGHGSRFVEAPHESELVRAVLGQEHI